MSAPRTAPGGAVPLRSAADGATRRSGRRRLARRAWARARSIAGWTLLLALSAFALLTIVLPFLLGAHTYTVLTGSMRPGMPPGSLVAVRETPVDDIRIGDVITFQLRSGEPTVVTHRVVGTTSSTGGDRLLLTRGDANDVEDPPVQAEQIRGIVVYAVPWLGYPGVLLGGQERGTLIVAAGVAIVGYGVALLVVDAVRGRGRRRALSALVAVALGAGPLLAAPPPPAAAASPADPASASPADPASASPADPAAADPARAFSAGLAAASAPRADPAPATASLQLSTDGATYTSGPVFPVFSDAGAFVPGRTVAVDLWIRNAGPDPAVAALRLDTGSAGSALAASLALVVDGTALGAGDEWRSRLLDPGESVRVEVGMRMDAAAANDTRRSRADVVPWVRLTGSAPGEAASDPTALPRTGPDLATLPALLLVAAALTALGLALRRHRRTPDGGR
ncbi:signal peptidase I [Microbacterium sp. HMH0099]|uniref:signal peptidase I n=1 Tax=Microbacterium sp. HMH0099 TaxID=3414026 RepID=UPI003BF631F3